MEEELPESLNLQEKPPQLVEETLLQLLNDQTTHFVVEERFLQVEEEWKPHQVGEERLLWTMEQEF